MLIQIIELIEIIFRGLIDNPILWSLTQKNTNTLYHKSTFEIERLTVMAFVQFFFFAK